METLGGLSALVLVTVFVLWFLAWFLMWWFGVAKISYDLYRGDPEGKEPTPVSGFLVFLVVFTAAVIGFFVMLSRSR